jgi:hypothetical protein
MSPTNPCKHLIKTTTTIEVYREDAEKLRSIRFPVREAVRALVKAYDEDVVRGIIEGYEKQRRKQQKQIHK